MELLNDAMIFPHPESNLEHDILSIGGDLSTQRLLLAYHYGIFPWFGEDDPIIWWSPLTRYVLPPSEVKVSKSMRNIFNRNIYTYTIDKEFDLVIEACANTKRQGQKEDGSWLTPEMIDAYSALHTLGFGHSVEVWNENEELVGGLYGIAIGKCFFGESMFSTSSNASKFGFISLCRYLDQQGFLLVDGQMPNKHLESLGFKEMERNHFISFLRSNIFTPTVF